VQGEDPDLKEQVVDEDADVHAALESLPEFDEIEEEVRLLSIAALFQHTWLESHGLEASS